MTPFRSLTSYLTLTAAALVVAASISSCSILHTRPVQEISDTVAALRAAREVQADLWAPELYRQANEIFFKARRQYRLKNFQDAEEFSKQARHLAERAEFEAIKNGANRSDGDSGAYAEVPGGMSAPPDYSSSGTAPSPQAPPSATPYPYPVPQPIPASDFDNPPPGAPGIVPTSNNGSPSG